MIILGSRVYGKTMGFPVDSNCRHQTWSARRLRHRFSSGCFWKILMIAGSPDFSKIPYQQGLCSLDVGSRRQVALIYLSRIWNLLMTSLWLYFSWNSKITWIQWLLISHCKMNTFKGTSSGYLRAVPNGCFKKFCLCKIRFLNWKIYFEIINHSWRFLDLKPRNLFCNFCNIKSKSYEAVGDVRRYYRIAVLSISRKIS